MRFLPGLGRQGHPLGSGVQRALETKDARAAVRRASDSGQYIFRGQPVQTDWSVDRAVKDGFERVIYVFRCADAIATSLSALKIVRRTGDWLDGPVVPGDPWVRLLNGRANELETGKQFRYRLHLQRLLNKSGVFVEVVLSQSGDPAGLYLLPPARTRPIPDPDRGLAGFEVRSADGELAELPPYDPANPRSNSVIWIRKGHPTNPYEGTTPMQAAGLSIDVSFYARLFNRNFMLNDGRPGGILAVRGPLGLDDAEELRARFAGGPYRAGRTTIVESDDVQWVDTSTTPRDAQYVESLNITKDEILLAFGTPESVLGNASGRTFDNADAEDEGYWEKTLVPEGAIPCDAFDAVSPGGVDDDSYLIHDYSPVAVLHRRKLEFKERLQLEHDKGLISLDEYREATGRDPIDHAGSKVLWIAAGKIPVHNDDLVQNEAEAMKAAGDGQGVDAPGEPLTDRKGKQLTGPDGEVLSVPVPEQQVETPKALTREERDAKEAELGGAAMAGTGASAGQRRLVAVKSLRDAVETKASPDHTDSAMIALYPQPAEARRVAVPGGLPPEELHLTLAFLGPARDVSGDDLVQRMRAVAEDVSPFPAKLHGLIAWDAGDEGTAWAAAVDAPELDELRPKVVKLAGNYSQHGFTPHMTRTYGASPVAPLDEVVTQITHLSVVVGSERWDIALGGGGEVTKVSGLELDGEPVDPLLFNEAVRAAYDALVEEKMARLEPQRRGGRLWRGSPPSGMYPDSRAPRVFDESPPEGGGAPVPSGTRPLDPTPRHQPSYHLTARQLQKVQADGPEPLREKLAGDQPLSDAELLQLADHMGGRSGDYLRKVAEAPTPKPRGAAVRDDQWTGDKRYFDDMVDPPRMRASEARWARVEGSDEPVWTVELPGFVRPDGSTVGRPLETQPPAPGLTEGAERLITEYGPTGLGYVTEDEVRERGGNAFPDVRFRPRPGDNDPLEDEFGFREVDGQNVDPETGMSRAQILAMMDQRSEAAQDAFYDLVRQARHEFGVGSSSRTAEVDRAVFEALKRWRNAGYKSVLTDLVDPVERELVEDQVSRALPRRAAQTALEAMEQELADELVRLWDRQQEVVLARLRGPKARKGTRHWEGLDAEVETKALDPMDLLDIVRWGQEAVKSAGTALRRIWRRVAGQDPTDAQLEESTRRIADSIAARDQQIRRAIEQAEAEGLPLSAIEARVREVYAPTPAAAASLARGSVTAVANAAALDAARRTSSGLHKQWLSSHDERVRPTHRVADGQTVPLDTPFRSGDALLQYPGDPTAPIGEVANCRCTVLLVPAPR